jgi:serine protease
MVAIIATVLIALPYGGKSSEGAFASSRSAAVGLIVRYASGVHTVAPDGSPTGQNFAGVALAKPRDLGGGLVSLAFERRLSQEQAKLALKQISRDKRIISAEIDTAYSFDSAAIQPIKKVAQSLNAFATYAKAFQPLSLQRVASSPLSLRVLNAVAPSDSRSPRIKLVWVAPKSLYTAKIVGYRVERKPSTASSWAVAISNTGRVTTSAYLSAGVQVGVPVAYRVRAITQLGASKAYGLASLSKSFVATVAPATPELVTANVIFSGDTVSWSQQDLSQRGGEAVTYTATATSGSGKALTCVTTSNSCSIDGLSARVPYLVQVSARNSVASTTTEKVSDSLYTTQWHLYSQYSVHADRAWQITQGSRDVVVAVLDSGITTHPDLVDNVLPGYDFVSDKNSSHDGDGWDPDPTDNGDWDSKNDSSWHGTHVAGIIAAAANSVGVRGVAPNVKILPVRVMGVTGGSHSDLIAAIHWASGIPVAGVPANPTPARVINMSMGTLSSQSCDSATQSAVRSAWDAGVTSVTAAGNSAFEASRSYPGNCYPTINVAATGVDGDIASYSNYGAGVDFSAPGGDESLSSSAVPGSDGMILSTWNTGKTTPRTADYGLEEGTSMAAPVVAGVLALIYSVRPDLTSDDAYEVIKRSVQAFKPGTECALTAANYGSQVADSHCGAGIVDAGAAVRLATTYVHGG